MKHKLTLILSTLLVVFISTAAFLYFRYNKYQKKLSILEFSVIELNENQEELESKIGELQDENEELQDQLDNVEHFDNTDFSRGRSSGSSGVSYTGYAMETKIDGEFTGWEGETIFKMMNGSIWQQASYDYTYHYAYMPDVIIYHKDGGYYMRVEGVDDEIRITRIK